METRISATMAARKFSDLVNRARYRGEVFIVERGGEPVCRIIPAGIVRYTLAEFVGHLRGGPKPDPGYWDTLEAITRRQPGLPKSRWRR